MLNEAGADVMEAMPIEQVNHGKSEAGSLTIRWQVNVDL
jgi:hypothetical protein